MQLYAIYVQTYNKARLVLKKIYEIKYSELGKGTSNCHC